MRFGLVLMLFVISLFAGRLVQLQGLDAPALAAKALASRTKEVNLPAHRGDITDASGAVLATTVERRDLLVDQTLVAQYKRLVGHVRIPVGLSGAAEDLAPLLRMTTAQVTARLTGTSRGATLATGVTPEVARQVVRLTVPGLAATQSSTRVYPAAELGANLLGFVARDGHPVGGLEQGLDSTLQGTNGSITYEVGEDGTQIPTGVTDEKDPTDGSTVRLTIDRDLQWTAQQMLAEQVAATQSDYGSIAVIDPHTGAILALATAPSFDPNHPGRARAQDIGDRPLLDVFEPGSTSKVVTLSAALEERVATPLSQVSVPNTLRRADRTFHDAESHGTERLTVAGVLAQSSNIGTILTGEKVPPATMERYMRGFGLGGRAGVGLPESSGRLDPAASWSDSQRFTVLFGQGLSVNVLQSAQVFATLANDGVRVSPQLISGWTDALGVRHPGAAGTSTRVVSATTAEQMRQMMEGVVVEGGTAVKAAVPGYRVAGKTGTAQRYLDSCHCYSGYTASFIGMAPADHPALVIAVVLQNPRHGHFGGEVAAPVFSKLMTYALARRAVPPSTTPAPQIPTRWR
jgi:cell division protein FtsI (penicillin-binding protein 3)